MMLVTIWVLFACSVALVLNTIRLCGDKKAMLTYYQKSIDREKDWSEMLKGALKSNSELRTRCDHYDVERELLLGRIRLMNGLEEEFNHDWWRGEDNH